jgi:hypothetical protein
MEPRDGPPRFSPGAALRPQTRCVSASRACPLNLSISREVHARGRLSHGGSFRHHNARSIRQSLFPKAQSDLADDLSSHLSFFSQDIQTLTTLWRDSFPSPSSSLLVACSSILVPTLLIAAIRCVRSCPKPGSDYLGSLWVWAPRVHGG